MQFENLYCFPFICDQTFRIYSVDFPLLLRTIQDVGDNGRVIDALKFQFDTNSRLCPLDLYEKYSIRVGTRYVYQLLIRRIEFGIFRSKSESRRLSNFARQNIPKLFDASVSKPTKI